MKKESWAKRLLIKILTAMHILESKEIDKKEMCEKAVKSKVCPGCCEYCAWGEGQKLYD